MCWWAVAAQVAMQAYGMRQQYNAQAKYLEAQAQGATKEMNYAFQNYEIERQDAYDAAVNDIIKTRINQMQLNSQVNAAIAEGYAGGGRTANRLMQAAEADTSRSVDYIANLQKQGEISRSQKFADILSLASTALSGYNEYKTQSAAAKAKGGTFNFWGSHSPNTKSSGSFFTYNSQGLPSMANYTNIYKHGKLRKTNLYIQ